MSAARRLNPNQPRRSQERRRLLPYFLAAILIHLTLLVFKIHDADVWKPAPLGAMSLTLGKPLPAPVLQPAPVLPPPRPTPPAPQKPEKIIAIPHPHPGPSVRPPPPGVSTEAAAQAALPAVTPATAPATAPTASPAPTPPPAESPGNPGAATAPPRFDAAYLLNPKPDYPSLSRRLGEEGRVLLKVRVTAQGFPTTVELEKSSGFERLDDAARRVVARWRFVPAKRGEQPVEASVIVPIAFRLEG